MNGDVAVGSASATGDWMRGRFGRLSTVVSAVVSCSVSSCSCRRFFAADLSSFVFFVFADFGVLLMASVDIVAVWMWLRDNCCTKIKF